MKILKILGTIMAALFLLLMGIIAVGSTAAADKTLNAGPNEELYQAESITDSEAKKALKALKDTGYFSGSSTAGVRISRDNEEVMIAFILTPEARKNDQVKPMFSNIGCYVLSQSVDKTLPYKLGIADEDLTIVETLPAVRFEETTELNGSKIHLLGSREMELTKGAAEGIQKILGFSALESITSYEKGVAVTKLHLLGVKPTALESSEVAEALAEYTVAKENFRIEVTLSTSSELTDRPDKTIKP